MTRCRGRSGDAAASARDGPALVVERRRPWNRGSGPGGITSALGLVECAFHIRVESRPQSDLGGSLCSRVGLSCAHASVTRAHPRPDAGARTRAQAISLHEICESYQRHVQRVPNAHPTRAQSTWSARHTLNFAMRPDTAWTGSMECDHRQARGLGPGWMTWDRDSGS